MELEFGSSAVSYDNAHTLLGGSVEGLIRHGVTIGGMIHSLLCFLFSLDFLIFWRDLY
jgi:hypothetical protein